MIPTRYLAIRLMQITRKDNPNGSMEFNMQLSMKTIMNASNVSSILVGWRSSLSSKFQCTSFFSNRPICTTKASFFVFLNFVEINIKLHFIHITTVEVGFEFWSSRTNNAMTHVLVLSAKVMRRERLKWMIMIDSRHW